MIATLAIVGCGPRLEVALQAPGMAAPAVIALTGPTPRSDLIMAAVDLLLRAADLKRSEIGRVVATRGPGSFTGIRVALATAQGLGLALGIQAVGVTSLLAQALRVQAGECLAVQPARRGQVYAQVFVQQPEGWSPAADPGVVLVESLIESNLPVVSPAGLALPPGTPIAPTIGTAAEALLTLDEDRFPGGLDTLSPFYLEPPPAVPPARTAKPWPPSPRAS
ncbi:MAG TPA: tRNA (adenosine(37)-N6)-threonylcarbamoyltransferase complex dimerization subunit type 1 TsaB [Thermoanaerobaculaceae bacterium]|nr:tRNA (adenosine(37)-N6)-threonylcarbamoyltransferase complex dimerization subunit type 1 TsaB [Thermoanaerobaculaceae bacterium]